VWGLGSDVAGSAGRGLRLGRELWAPSGFGGSQPSQSIAGGRSVETSVRG